MKNFIGRNRSGVGKRQALALEPASPFCRPGRPAWVTALALMSENKRIPGTGRPRPLKGFSLLLPLPLLSPHPPFYFFLLAAKPKHCCSHEFRSCGQMAGAGGAGCRAGTRELPRPEVAPLGTTEFGFSP